MPDISETYEKKLLKQILSYSRSINAVYEQAIIDIAIVAASVNYRGTVISLDLYPALKRKLDEIMQQMHGGIYTTVINSVKQSWALSNEKNNAIANSLIKGARLSDQMKDLVYNPNAGALNQFLKRKQKGLNLSDRVWKQIKPFRFELEAGVLDGIASGRSAASMATDLKRYLNEPDKLFRRVRDSNGKLQLSKAAKDYHPGQGVYRSSYKNSLRLTRTETNISYRSADNERWLRQPFVKGIRIKLSAQHPTYDICDPLAGDYDKHFLFKGWHPQCICYQVPILATAEEYEAMEDYMLGLTKTKPKLDYVQGVPDKFTEYLKENKDRINGWKNKPYWVQDNKKFVGELKSS